MGDHKAQFTFLDYSNEKSPFSVNTGAITLASIAGFLTDFGALRTAIDAITSGTIHQEKWVGDDTLLSNTLPTNPLAQREIKWLVRYRDTTSNEIYTLTVPTADPTGLDGSSRARMIPGTDLANLENTDMAAFVAEFEGIARSPEADDHLVEVLSMKLVGRNI